MSNNPMNDAVVEAVQTQLAALVDQLEGMGLFRQDVIAGMEAALQQLKHEPPKGLN